MTRLAVIDHGGGMTTLYAHQSQLNVSYGQEVAAADTIGYIGTSGYACSNPSTIIIR